MVSLWGCSPSITGEISEAKIDLVTDSEHRIFITSSTYDGDLGGRTGANAKCQAKAATAGLQRTYIAILSFPGICSTNGALNLISTEKPVYAVDTSGARTKVAEIYAKLWDAGGLLSPILFDQNGNTVSTTDDAWTGTFTHGCASGFNCNSWTDGTFGGGGGAVGDSAATTLAWSYSTSDSCDTFHRIYCISQ
jgi:hypothetical protein